MSETARRPRSGSSAKAVLLTTLGEFVLPHRGFVWTSTVVRSLGVLGVDARNARQAVTRLVREDIVRSERDGRRARLRLTDHGTELLSAGTERIYRFGNEDDQWDEHWLVVLCSVPEEQRAKRHRLRSELAFAGFGFLGQGVALSPHLAREERANSVLKDLGLLPGAAVFRAEVGQLVPVQELLERAWDLDALADRYGEFIQAFGDRTPESDEERFRSLTELVHAWRHFPFVDPEIPVRLLSSGWPGRRAKDLFDDRHARWAPGANRWYERAEHTAG
jgi:phenylacetic acid degradation operon negative regulatory protein